MIQIGCSTWVRHYSVTIWRAVIAIAVCCFFQSNMLQLCQKHSQRNVLIKKRRRLEGQNQRSVQSNQVAEAENKENLIKEKKNLEGRKSEGTWENTANHEREVQHVDLNVSVNERQVKLVRVITGGGERRRTNHKDMHWNTNHGRSGRF